MKKERVNDIQLWTNFRKGDNLALSEIYSANAKNLYWYGLSFTKNELLIEDAIQDLFSELIQSRERLSTTNNIHFYLIKSFKRILQRKINQEKRFLLSDNQSDYVFEVTHSIEYLIVEEEAHTSQLHSLYEAIQMLTSRQKEAIYLRFSSGLSYEETADIMDMTIESCRNLIYKAVRSLKKSLS